MKIISGGQTGADLGGLEGARDAGIETGGTAPWGFRTENGANLELKTIYGLVASNAKNYNYRTQQNVINSDATVIFARDIFSPGTKLTIELCNKHNKPCLLNPSSPKGLKEFCRDIKVLNVAGNRESKAVGLQKEVRKFIVDAFKE